MNICFLSVCQFDEFAGGVDRVCCILSREFIRRGHQIVYVYGNPSRSAYPSVGCEGNGQYQFPYTIWDDRNISFFSDIITKHKVDFVIDTTFIVRFHDVVYQARQKTPFKLITNYHGDPLSALKDIQDKIDCLRLHHDGFVLFAHRLFSYLKYPYSYYTRLKSLKSRMNKIVRESDYYVVLCEDFAKRICQISGCSRSSHIVAINNPIDLNNDSILSCSKKNQVLFVGRLNEQKRVDRLLRVWKIVENKSDNWELIVIGDGDARDKYEEYAHHLRLKKVRFIGNVNSSEEMWHSKIVTMVSSHEGFAMTLIEGMSVGTVPIAYDSYESLRDIVDNGVNGFRVKPFSQSEFAARIIELVYKDELWLSMSAAAMEKAKQFDVRTIADQWDALFHS